MEKQVLICSLLVALVLLSCPVIMSQEVVYFFSVRLYIHSLMAHTEDESEFNYDVKSEIGPFNWGDIKPEWSLCKNGSMQSPIDLLNERVQIVSHLGTLQMNYRPSNATLKNRGHDIKLEWLAGTSYLQINETRYVLKQFHWHSPSEHTIDGKRLDLELHMVHETPSGQTAVIGILYKAGRPDPFLSLLTNHLEAISDSTGAEREVGVMDPRMVKIGRSRTQYYRYIGSLTVPPCTENIAWTMLREVRSVSREQIRLLRVAVHDDSNTNARPLQLINNRLLFDGTYTEDESEFNYDVKGKIGPFNWGDIKPEWSLCKTGTMQSPIDLSNAKVQTAELGPLQLNSKPSKAILKNRGHDISLQWPATTSSLQINGTQYVLKQSHWHSPSEHTIDGRRMDLELHMVHQTPSDQTAVIGILYKAGERPDPFLSLFANHILPLSDRPDAEKDMGVIDPMEVKIGTSATQYYRYIGSLTTPPCTENVIWTVLKEVKPVAREHIKLLRDAVHDNEYVVMINW
ncbi:Alpha carbonic anhydrase 7, partial [Mucuna pruriens]